MTRYAAPTPKAARAAAPSSASLAHLFSGLAQPKFTGQGYFSAAVAPYAAAHRQRVQGAAFGTNIPAVLYNSNYYNTARGREELAQENRAQAEQQLAAVREQLQTFAGSQGFFDGANVHTYDPETVAQRQQIVAEPLAVLESLQPLIASGLVGERTIQKAVGQSVQDSFEQQRSMRRAQADIATIRRGVDSGNLSLQQAMGALGQAEEEYGHSVLLNIPDYAELTGASEKLQEAKEGALTQFAEARGIDRRFVTWDPKANQPTFNPDEFKIEQVKAGIKELEDKPRNDARKVFIDYIRFNTPREKDYKDITGTRTDVDRFNSAQQRVVEQAMKVTKALAGDALSDEELTSLASEFGVSPSSVGNSLADDTASQVMQPVGNTQQRFRSTADATAAIRAGKVPKGSSFFVGGVHFTLGANGKAIPTAR